MMRLHEQKHQDRRIIATPCLLFSFLGFLFDFSVSMTATTAGQDGIELRPGC